MDVNEDGELDILSGSYSRHDPDMAGLFQVLLGKGKGEFARAAVLQGSDGEPLIIPASKDRVTDKICTRPTAVDLDGDGTLDLVAGNFSGTFAWFRGEGKGKFAPQPTWLEGADGKRLQVRSHGDPWFVDWDGDGDLDLVSGSAQGGVFLSVNGGSRTKPAFGAFTTLVEPVGHARGDELRFGDDHLQGPQADTRVYVADFDGDGRLDLLVGDAVTIERPAEGLDEAAARKRFAEWQAEQAELSKRMQGNRGQPPDEAAMKEYQEAFAKHWEKRATILATERTGFVWLFRQQAGGAGTGSR